MNQATDNASELQQRLNEASSYYEEGARIWNTAGLNYPQLKMDAALAALLEYRKAIQVLEDIDLESLSLELRNAVLGNREFVLAATSDAQASSHDEWNDEGLEEIIRLTGQGIDHLEKAIRFFESSVQNDENHLFRLRNESLFDKARMAFMLARRAGRLGNSKEALQHYRRGQENYAQLMEIYEAKSPELIAIKQEVEKKLVKMHERKWEGDSSTRNVGIRWTAYAFRWDDEPTGSPYEDLYRRASANHCGCSASIANLEGLIIVMEGGSPLEVDGKLAESIEFTYRAMEVFPDNLAYHQDLFNAWMARGETVGCPMEESTDYYHTQCPLAIMHYIGAWYVSPTFEYDGLICSVCGKDAIECPHYPGQVVDGEIVHYRRQNLFQSSLSLVDVPQDPRCRLQWLSIPKSYFPVPLENPRLKCRFCHPEDYKDEKSPFLSRLPESMQGDVEARYQQIINTRRRFHLDLNKEVGIMR